jgi:hypothetical protein
MTVPPQVETFTIAALAERLRGMAARSGRSIEAATAQRGSPYARYGPIAGFRRISAAPLLRSRRGLRASGRLVCAIYEMALAASISLRSFSISRRRFWRASRRS